VVDRDRRLQREIGGKGAGRRHVLDCFFHFLSRVLSSKVKDRVLVLFIFKVLYVKCTPPIMN
jgi:hypothetical protein